MVRMRHILFKHGGGKVSGEYLLIKRGRLELGYDQYDQQRSINLFLLVRFGNKSILSLFSNFD